MKFSIRVLIQLILILANYTLTMDWPYYGALGAIPGYAYKYFKERVNQ